MTFKKKLTPLIWNLEPQVTPNSEYSKHQHGVIGRQFPGQKPFPAVKSSGCRFVSLMITALCMWGEMLSQLPQPTCQSYCGWQEMALPLTCLPCPLSRLLKICIRIFKRDSFTGTRKKKSGSGCAAFGTRVHTAFGPSHRARTKHLHLFPVFQSPLLLIPHSQSAITFLYALCPPHIPRTF